MARELRISCDDCTMKNSDHCGDCVVSFFIDREPSQAVVFDLAEFLPVSNKSLLFVAHKN